MIMFYTSLAAFLAIVVGVASGLGPGVIIKTLFDAANFHSITEISFYISVAFLPMVGILSYRRFHNNKTPVDISRMAVAAVGAVVGAVLGEYLLEYAVLHLSAVLKGIQACSLIIILVLLYLDELKILKIKESKIETKPKVFILSTFLALTIVFLSVGGRGLNLAAYLTFFPYDKNEAPVLSLVIIFFAQITKITKIFVTTGFGQFDGKIVILLIIVSAVGTLMGIVLNNKIPKKYNHSLSIGILSVILVLAIVNLVRLF